MKYMHFLYVDNYTTDEKSKQVYIIERYRIFMDRLDKDVICTQMFVALYYSNDCHLHFLNQGEVNLPSSHYFHLC